MVSTLSLLPQEAASTALQAATACVASFSMKSNNVLMVMTQQGHSTVICQILMQMWLPDCKCSAQH